MESNFWRYYRLVLSQRWWLMALAAVAGAVILVGATLRSQKQLQEAVALIEPQTEELRNLMSDQERKENNDRRTDDIDRVSDLIMLLRSSNDLYLRAARLLRMNEDERAREVERILDQNGYFAPAFAMVESQAKQRVAEGDLLPSEAAKWKKDSKKRIKQQQVDSFARARDARGAFASGGMTQPEDEIVAQIRKHMAFDTVSGPLSTAENQQIVNQIRIAGAFDRGAEAELYVNLVCIAFIDFYLGKSDSVLNARIERLNVRQREAKELLDKSRKGLASYQQQKGVTQTSAQEQVLADYLRLQNDQKGIQQKLAQSRANVSALQIAFNTLKANPTLKAPLPSGENPMLREYERNVITAEAAFNQIKNSNYGPGSDEWKKAEKDYQDAKAAYQTAKSQPFSTTLVNANIQAIQNQLEVERANQAGLTSQLKELDRQVAEQKAKVDLLPATQGKVADLKKEVADAEQIYDDISRERSRLQMQAIGRSRAGVINIVSQAHVTDAGSSPLSQRLKLLLYGVVLSVIFGIGLIIGLDVLDNSIQTTEDVEKLLGLPVMGVIPAQLSDPTHASRITHLDPLSPISETYRMLRTDLIFTLDGIERNQGRRLQSVMVATGKPGQGATTTISNLAITLAQSGRRVILIDADMRYPKLHNVFRVPNKIGLSSLLEDRATIEDALQTCAVENLMILPAGPVPINPAELIGSQRMRSLHEQLKKLADFVLVDTPSAIVFADAALLSSIMDATLMVVRASNIPRGAEDQVRKVLNKANANIIGVALNGVPAERVDSVHYHQNYYPILYRGDGEAASVRPAGEPGLPTPRLPDNIPLALPGLENDPISEATGTTTLTREEETQAMPATSPRPGFDMRLARPIDKPKTQPLQRIPWKILLGVLIGGAIIGLMVLLLATGAGVK